MAKLSIISPICMLMIIIALLLPAPSSAAYSEPKVTKLRFFLQTTFSGPNTSVYPVARSEITSKSPTLFGLASVFDDPFTVNPNPDSEMMGRAQGTVAFADLNEQAVHVSLTFHFTSGEYNGSTLTMVGRNSLAQKCREMPIVGGSGAFQLAQGIAITTTYSTSPQNDHMTREFNITFVQMYRLFG